MKTKVFLAALCFSTSMSAANAAPIELLTNGGFETGDFTGWTPFVADDSAGTIAVISGTTEPGGFGLTVPAAAEGTFHAVSGQTGPGAQGVLQSFTVGTDFVSLSLSFEAFVVNSLDQLIDTGDLEFQGDPNQHARVDLIEAGADPFAVGASVVRSVLDPFDGPSEYTPFNVDLSDLAAGDYALRFVQADNQGFFNLGVDDVSLIAETADVGNPTPISEPGTLALLALGLLGLVFKQRRA